jgi:DNA-directed RNA polymerase subunit RPC12/RpoP
MHDRFIFTRHKTTCYHCGTEADQVIKAVPYQAQVICAHCGATRVFVPRAEEVSPKGAYTRIGCFDVWELEPVAKCRNCGLSGPHDLFIGCNHFTARCQHCGFTHFYKFNLEYMGQCAILGAGEEGTV